MFIQYENVYSTIYNKCKKIVSQKNDVLKFVSDIYHDDLETLNIKTQNENDVYIWLGL